MTSPRCERALQQRLSDHRAAVAEFIEKAGALHAEQWFVPRAEGKWTPAQETRHVILAYEMFLSQLNGGPPMRLRGTAWKRRMWRLVGLTSILWRKRIPVAVRAPGEVRPDAVTATASQLIPALRGRASEFEVAFAAEWRTAPRTLVTHFMFGKLRLDHAIQIMSVHTRHHAAFLPTPRKVQEATASDSEN